jgi:adenylate cyclase
MEEDARLGLARRAEVIRLLPADAVNELVSGCTLVPFHVGDVLFELGDAGDSLYVVASGRFEIYAGDTRLDEAGAGESFGEMALLTNEPRAASVRALEESVVLHVPRDRFQSVIERHPHAMSGILRDLAGKVKSSIRVRVDQHKSAARVREAFARSVSTEVMNQVLAQGDPSQLLDGVERPAAVLFADVRSFTTTSESLAPKEVLRLLNGYLSKMVDAVLAHGGTLDKFLGDGMMALFGLPIATDDYVTSAVRSAIEMQRTISAHVGIGIATGSVVAGCVGNERRMEYTAIGDVVNLASRIEGLTKVYGCGILVCGASAAAVGDTFVLRRVDRVRAKGKAKPTDLYDVLGPPTPDASRLRDEYAAAFEAYSERRFARAREAFVDLAERVKDAPARVMAMRCAELEERCPAPWDGVFSFDHK